MMVLSRHDAFVGNTKARAAEVGELANSTTSATRLDLKGLNLPPSATAKSFIYSFAADTGNGLGRHTLVHMMMALRYDDDSKI